MCLERLVPTTICPEYDIIRFRIVATFKKEEKQVSRTEVNVARVSPRQHVRLENNMRRGGLTLHPVRIQKLSASS